MALSSRLIHPKRSNLISAHSHGRDDFAGVQHHTRLVDDNGAGLEADGARREASRKLRHDGADAIRQGAVAEGEGA